MDLYIEKEFLDNFYIEIDEDNISNEEEIVITMLSEYGNKSVFMNYEMNSIEELEALKIENKYFALMCAGDKSPIEIEDIKKQLFSSDFNQALVFMNKKEKWFEEAEKNGALCFSFSNYKKRIKEIIKHCHKKHFLYGDWKNWEVFEKYKIIPGNLVLINDRFLFTGEIDRNLIPEKIKKNLEPLLKNFLNVENTKTNIWIYADTSNIQSIPNKDNFIKDDNFLQDRIEKIYTNLNTLFAKFKVNFSIYAIRRDYSSIEFHDRFILTNFLFIEIPKGLDLNAQLYGNNKIKKPVDTSLSATSIFDKDTYIHINRKKQDYIKYNKHLNTSLQSGFKCYPKTN